MTISYQDLNYSILCNPFVSLFWSIFHGTSPVFSHLFAIFLSNSPHHLTSKILLESLLLPLGCRNVFLQLLTLVLQPVTPSGRKWRNGMKRKSLATLTLITCSLALPPCRYSLRLHRTKRHTSFQKILKFRTYSICILPQFLGSCCFLTAKPSSCFREIKCCLRSWLCRTVLKARGLKCDIIGEDSIISEHSTTEL